VRRIAPLGLLLVALLLPASSHAGFPGTNGRIAFETNRDGNFEIYSMNADGSDQRNLTHNAAYDTLPAWSPDGAKIAFTSDRDGKYDVYVMNADGSDVRRVTSGTARNSAAGWSPDGTKILFDSDELSSGPGGRESDVMVVNVDGTGVTALTTDPATDEYGAWSPGGDQIAFTSTRDGNEDVYTMNADGSAQTNITNTNLGYFNPDWSPDGSRIAVDRGSILVMNRDGTNRVNISNPSGSDFNPAWSPDGTRIAFDTWRDGNSEIYSMGPDGTGRARLTTDPAADTYPDWQPVPVRYARPKGATPFRVPLVTALQQCTAPNRTHGAPLAFPSCRFPRQVYPFVTVGTPDANGAPAKSVGYVQFDVAAGMPGPPNDSHVYITAKVSDVRCGAAVDPPPPSAAGLCERLHVRVPRSMRDHRGRDRRFHLLDGHRGRRRRPGHRPGGPACDLADGQGRRLRRRLVCAARRALRDPGRVRAVEAVARVTCRRRSRRRSRLPARRRRSRCWPASCRCRARRS
jgi:dipeptidyl aminopeptidase/acylaminoacyl peptidase